MVMRYGGGPGKLLLLMPHRCRRRRCGCCVGVEGQAGVAVGVRAPRPAAATAAAAVVASVLIPDPVRRHAGWYRGGIWQVRQYRRYRRGGGKARVPGPVQVTPGGGGGCVCRCAGGSCSMWGGIGVGRVGQGRG